MCVCVCFVAYVDSHLQIIQRARQAEAFGASEGAAGRRALGERREPHGQAPEATALKTKRCTFRSQRHAHR